MVGLSNAILEAIPKPIPSRDREGADAEKPLAYARGFGSDRLLDGVLG